jgi:hypothetical protein
MNHPEMLHSWSKIPDGGFIPFTLQPEHTMSNIEGVRTAEAQQRDGQEGRERGRGEEEVYRRRASSRSCSNAFTCSSSTCARHPGMREKEAPGRVRGPVF